VPSTLALAEIIDERVQAAAIGCRDHHQLVMIDAGRQLSPWPPPPHCQSGLLLQMCSRTLVAFEIAVDEQVRIYPEDGNVRV